MPRSRPAGGHEANNSNNNKNNNNNNNISNNNNSNNNSNSNTNNDNFSPLGTDLTAIELAARRFAQLLVAKNHSSLRLPPYNSSKDKKKKNNNYKNNKKSKNNSKNNCNNNSNNNNTEAEVVEKLLSYTREAGANNNNNNNNNKYNNNNKNNTNNKNNNNNNNNTEAGARRLQADAMFGGPVNEKSASYKAMLKLFDINLCVHGANVLAVLVGQCGLDIDRLAHLCPYNGDQRCAAAATDLVGRVMWLMFNLALMPQWCGLPAISSVQCASSFFLLGGASSILSA
ncbi:unnamed protein product, partial [Polarella glacialis]